MKIIFIGAYETPDIGGINSYVLNLSIQLKKMGHHCMVIRLSDRDYASSIHGINFVNLTAIGPKMAGSACYPKAIKYILTNKLQPDFVVFQSYVLAPFVDWKLKYRGIKVCYIQHSFAYDNPKNNFLVTLPEQVLERFTACWAKNLITVSEHMATLVRKRLHLTPAIVRGGVFMPEENNSSSSILSQNNLNKDDYFLTIARIDPIKNLHILIEAFKNYQGNKKLVIGGNAENPYGRELKNMSKEDNRIIFSGPLVGTDKDTMLRNCFAYCMVSSSEGFPISLLEAMSYGKRCICSDIEPNIEALSSDLGTWCQVGSANDITNALSISELETDTERAIKESKIKNRLLNNFTWEASAKTFVEYLNTI